MGGEVTTDVDGRYWVGGLSAGEYNVAVAGLTDAKIIFFGTVTETAGMVSATGAVFRPGADDPPAQVKIELASGEERTVGDMVIRFSDRFAGPRPIDTGTATVSGQVVDANGVGLPHASVVLHNASERANGSYTTTADGGGRFVFQNVPAGSLTLGALERVGAGAAAAAGRSTTLQIAAGSHTENVILTGARGGAISGTLTDEFGDPVMGAAIATTLRGAGLSGEVVSFVTGPDGVRVAGRAATVDARGRYRITPLPPGEYLISANVGNPLTGRTEIHFEDQAGQDRILARGPVFYPGVSTVSQATKIVVAESSDSASVDLVVSPVLVANINVTVTANRPVTEIQLHQILLDEQLPMLERSPKMTGSTITLDARRGRYRLLASAEVASNADNVTRLWSSADVEADPLLPAQVNMVLEPGANVSGRILFDGKETNRQSAGAWLLPMTPLPGVRIPTIDGNSALTVATGEFSVEGIMPGRYVIQAGGGGSGPDGLWTLKAATIRGKDVLDEPIDLAPGEEISDVQLTVTDRISELSGIVTDTAGKPSREGSVVVFAADKRYWFPGSRRIQVVRPNAEGRYTVRGLPAGTYLVALEPGTVLQHELLAKLPTLVAGAVRVTIAEGDKRALNLRRK